MTNAARFASPENQVLCCFFRIFLSALLFSSAMGCAERGLDAPRIERLGIANADTSHQGIRIATANLWGVSVMGVDWADQIDLRFTEFAERLHRGQPPLDVVLIQEAWKKSARRAILTHPGVARRFPHRVDAVERPGGSGLVILSRFPINAAHFHRFRAQGRCLKFWEGDCLSGKGVLAIQIQFGERLLWLGNTHLIACYAAEGDTLSDCDERDPNGEVRWRQLVEARQFMESLAGEEPALIAGDFNFARSSRHYLGMTSLEIPSGPNPTDSSVAQRGWFESGEKDPMRITIDYIWTRAGSIDRWQRNEQTGPILTEPVTLSSGEEISLSDHPILGLRLCLTPNDETTEFGDCKTP